VRRTNGTAIRPATDGDVEDLCGLYGEFHEFHARGVPDRLASLVDAGPAERERLRGRIREILGASDSTILVAESDGRIVGLAEVYVREDEPVPARVPHRYGHLQSMIVSEAHRGSGVGRLLLGASERWARERDASEMRLDTWEFPDGPLRFYERCGYRTLRRTLARDLK
jgi:GNAT superfamily N-acetyltransferase